MTDRVLRVTAAAYVVVALVAALGAVHMPTSVRVALVVCAGALVIPAQLYEHYRITRQGMESSERVAIARAAASAASSAVAAAALGGPGPAVVDGEAPSVPVEGLSS
ncbi:MAG TPA: hypothetical protein VGH66_01410 [Acidimicrobiales bacterium]|jgi:hypothetical protein